MTINFHKIKDFGLDKQKRIAKLIDERVALLVGKKCSTYIESISFCADLKDCRNGETNLLIGERALIKFNPLYMHPVSIHICLSERILFGILVPGRGQAEFDELLLEIRNALCEYVSSIK